MKRRLLLALASCAVLAPPTQARAQRQATPVVGYLSLLSADASAPFQAAFLDGLKETGFVDGSNVSIAWRWADGHHERLPALAAELVALKTGVIVTANPQTAVAAHAATRTIPIVFLSSDPVALGLVASLGRPGGNATGVSTFSPELAGKRLELLRELIPGARAIAFLANPAGPGTTLQLDELRSAARVTGHELEVVDARRESEIAPAFARLAERRPDALLVAADPLFLGLRDAIIALAARHAIPAMYGWPEFATGGGLISYSMSLRDALRLVGIYAGRILRGANPAELPVQQPTRFELVVNMKTARTLGLTIPPAILALADEVIE